MVSGLDFGEGRSQGPGSQADDVKLKTVEAAGRIPRVASAVVEPIQHGGMSGVTRGTVLRFSSVK